MDNVIEFANKAGIGAASAALPNQSTPTPTFKNRVDEAVAQCESQLTRLKEVQQTFEKHPELVGIIDNLYSAYLL